MMPAGADTVYNISARRCRTPDPFRVFTMEGSGIVNIGNCLSGKSAE